MRLHRPSHRLETALNLGMAACFSLTVACLFGAVFGEAAWRWLVS